MMKQILNSNQIEELTGKIRCGKEYGTLFLISPKRAITARHMIFDQLQNPRKEVLNIQFPTLSPSQTFVGELHNDYPELDIAFIDLPEDFPSEDFLPISCSQVALDSNWKSFGYPIERLLPGVQVGGQISLIKETHETWDMYLNIQIEKQLVSYKGMSGSAVVVDGFVAGIAVHEDGNTICSVSSSKLQKILDIEEIDYKLSEDHNTLHSLDESLENVIENAQMNNRLCSLLLEQQTGYLALTGQPGSGKTTFIAGFKEVTEEIVIIGKYFVRLPDEDVYSRIQRDTFVSWLERLCYSYLFGTLPPKQSIEESIESLNNLLNQLGQHFLSQQKRAILIIDGLDDVKQEGDIEHFLGFLPEQLPKGLICLYSLTSISVLPIKFQAQIQDEQTQSMKLLNITSVADFVLSELNGMGFSSEQLYTLAEKSEGHPLYLRYLLETVKSGQIDDISAWLSKLPIIEGDIQKYYQKLWIPLEQHKEKYWLTVILSFLRQQVEKDVLKEFLPQQQRLSFLTNFESIKFLLKESRNQVSIYHSSFSKFVQQAAQSHKSEAHEAVVEFCLTDKQNEFAISNIIFHLLQSKDAARAVAFCNQEWANQCALSHVEPSMVLGDIENVIIYCAKTGLVSELIDSLLLMQRVRFRYSLLWYDYAFELADVLITLEKPDKAIRYLIREGELAIPNSKAAQMVQKFSEACAFNESDSLVDVIHKNYLINSKKLMREQNGFDKNLYHMWSQSLTFNARSEEGIRLWSNFLFYIDGLRKISKKHQQQDAQDFFLGVMNEMSGFQTAYMLYRTNIYQRLDSHVQHMEEMGGTVSSDISLISALALNNYIFFQRESDFLIHAEELINLIEDLEKAIDSYGYDEQYAQIIAHSLIRYSKRSDIVATAISQFFETDQYEEFNIRAKNGVDLNQDFFTYFLAQIFKGYVGGETLASLNIPNSSNWQIWITRLIEQFAYNIGSVYRLKANSLEEEMPEAIQLLKNTFNNIGFSLKERITWEHSYLLPEHVLPLIYGEYTQFLLDFDESEINIFIENIEAKSSDQLGLYTEGYREILIDIAKRLIRYEQPKNLVFRILKLLEFHIQGVQNRAEKVPLLLKLFKLYSLINHTSKIEQTYKAILDSSMGPAWYKEDQFRLVNTTVSNIALQPAQYSHLSNFASIFEVASGEMTFQRYITQNMESFVADICNSASMKQAVTLLKQWILPDIQIIKENAEKTSIDMPDIGYGYDLGARYINEQSVISKLLLRCSDVNPLIAWVFSEVFIQGDLRYAGTFAKIQARALNKLQKEQKKSLINKVYSRLLRVCRYVYQQSEDVGDEVGCNHYFENLFNELEPNLNQRLMDSVDEDLIPKSDKKVSHHTSTFDVNVERCISLAKESIVIEDFETANSHILDALYMHQEKGISIWNDYWSSDLAELWELLQETTSTCSDVLKLLSPFVSNPLLEEWLVVDHLIEQLRERFSEKESKDIYKSVKEHLTLMVSPSEIEIERNSWLAKEEKNIVGADHFLLELLIWFLNHPGVELRDRVQQVLEWLAANIPNTLLPLFVKETIFSQQMVSAHISAILIEKMAQHSPEIVWEYFKQNQIIDQIYSRNHFQIQFNYIKALECIQTFKENKEVEHHINNLKQVLISSKTENLSSQPESIGTSNIEKLFDSNLQQINDYITSLPDVLAKAVQNQMSLCTKYSLSISDFERVSHYIDRSFYEEKYLHNFFSQVKKSALNTAIVGFVKEESLDKLNQILSKQDIS